MVDRNNDGVPDQEINIDGVKVRTKDLFPDDASRMDFHTKLKLLKSPASGEDDMEPSVADQLFGNVQPIKPITEGEPDAAGLEQLTGRRIK